MAVEAAEQQQHSTAATLETAATDLAAADPSAIAEIAQQQWVAAWQHSLGGGGGSGSSGPNSGDQRGSGSQRTAYGTIKTSFGREPYLEHPEITHRQRSALARLRCGASWLAAHTMIYVAKLKKLA